MIKELNKKEASRMCARIGGHCEADGAFEYWSGGDCHGRVAWSIIDVGAGDEFYAHHLLCTTLDPRAMAALSQALRRKAREMGFSEVKFNVANGSIMLKLVESGRATIESYNLTVKA